MSETVGRTSRPITRCQICDGPRLEPVLFLGFVPPVNTMPPVGSVAEEQVAYPLELLRCPDCSLVQIGLEVDASVLFPPDYPYLSSSTRILRENFADLGVEAGEILGLRPGEFVVDIGSNDGTLLENFQRAGCKVLGVEPSRAAEVAVAKGIPSRMGFFGEATAAAIRESEGRPRLVTAANVFAHIGGVHGIVDAIAGLLAPGGAFVSESHYLLDLVEKLQYDAIYHEHLRYYSVTSLGRLLKAHGLEIFHVRRILTHGGSIRVYAARPGTYPVRPSVAAILREEAESGVVTGEALRAFRDRVIESKLALHALLYRLKREGARIYGIGAPSRASTLINHVGLDDGIIDAVMEVSTSRKVNKYIPGTRIPVLEESRLFAEQPEYALLLSWHITDELVANLRRKGFKGKFITPLPEPGILPDAAGA